MNLTAGHRFDKDVELFLYYDNSHHPSAVVEAGASAAPSGTTLNIQRRYQYNMHDMIQFGARTVPPTLTPR